MNFFIRRPQVNGRSPQRFEKRFNLPRLFVAAMAVALYPQPGHAQSVGDVFCNVFENVSGMTFLISGIAWIIGAALVIRGIFDIIKRSSDPNKPLKDGLLGICCGAAVAAFPYFIDWLQKTVYRGTNGTTFNCLVDNTAGAGGAPVPLDVMLFNFVQNISSPIVMLMSALAIIFGASMIFYNMIKLSKFGSDAKSNSLTPIIGSLIIGAVLMALGTTMDVSLGTLFGDGTTHGGEVQYDGIAYQPGGGFDMERFDRAMRAVFIFLYIVGSLSFIRGFFILRNALEGSGQATKGQAFTHIIGGTLLVNMPNFIRIIEQSVGFRILA
jgi:uncharacterized membrane protein HdeD (DUF308 family)